MTHSNLLRETATELANVQVTEEFGAVRYVARGKNGLPVNATEGFAGQAKPLPALRNSDPSVLVLLAARNGEEFIERQLQSILKQTNVRVSITVRDDGSLDGTRKIVKRFCRVDSRVKLHPDHKASGSAAANFFQLIRDANVGGFDFIALSDQDDEWLSFKLHRATQVMRDNGAEGYSSAVKAVWPNGHAPDLTQCDITRKADYLFEGAGQGCTFVFAATLFRRLQQALDQQRSMQSELHFHDWTMYAIARSICARWHFDSQVTMLYHQHGGNDTGARTSKSGIARRVELIRSGWYRHQVTTIVSMVRATNPDDKSAQEWLSLCSAGSFPFRRLRKLLFVAKNGRRRRTDRYIQLAAIALGYL